MNYGVSTAEVVSLLLLAFSLNACSPSGDMEQRLKAEQAQLREQLNKALSVAELERERADAVDASFNQLNNELISIVNQLAELSETEVRISRILVSSTELPPPRSISSEIQELIRQLEGQLERARLGEQYIQQILGENEGLVQFSNNLAATLEKHEQTIKDLRSRTVALEQKNEVLRRENELISQRVSDLGQQLVVSESDHLRCAKLLEQLSSSIRHGYVLALPAASLGRLDDQGFLEKKKRKLFMPRGALVWNRDRMPALKRVDTEEKEICIASGGGSRAEVVSIHQFLDDYSASQVDDQLCLELEDPETFWSVSHFLIIRLD